MRHRLTCVQSVVFDSEYIKDMVLDQFAANANDIRIIGIKGEVVIVFQVGSANPRDEVCGATDLKVERCACKAFCGQLQ